MRLTNYSRHGLCRAFVLLLLVLHIFAARVGAEPLSVGQRAAFCTLSAIDGKAYTFPAKDGWSMVFFWSLFCGSCLEEMPVIQERLQMSDTSGLNVFFVSIDTDRMKKALVNFAKVRKLNYPVLLEQLASGSYFAADKWGVVTTPSVFFADPKGVVAFSHTGPIDIDELFNILNEAKQKFANGESYE